MKGSARGLVYLARVIYASTLSVVAVPTNAFTIIRLRRGKKSRLMLKLLAKIFPSFRPDNLPT